MVDLVRRILMKAVMGVGRRGDKLGKSIVTGCYPTADITTGWTTTGWRFESIRTKMVMLSL